MEIKILHKISTHYNQITVLEEFPIRKLLFGYGMCQEQGAINLEDINLSMYDFYSMFMHSFLFVPKPSNILVIGLGAAVNPRYISRYFPDANMDIIEIDSEIVKIAKEFFFYEKSDNTNIHIGDAFEVVNKLDKKYDVILLDAFDKHYIPTRLMSMRFNKILLNAINNSGVLAINMCNAHPSFFSHINTVRNIFGDNLFLLNGIANPYVTMIYAPIKTDFSGSTYDFIARIPSRLEITDNIKNAKIIK